jgi:C_GCAxxG_C_C family probable redox protein
MISNSKANDAVTRFNDGFNCSQAILSTYCEEFNFDEKTALQIACGFGAGMGRLQETCGAVLGAYLLIGLKYGQYLKHDKPAKEKTYALVREFARLFEERNKTTCCRELLGVDLVSGDSQTAVERVKTICPQMVRDAAEIIEAILFSDEEQE